ncbi:MAG: FAD-dependent oxidoreductase [Sphingobium sp.]
MTDAFGSTVDRRHMLRGGLAGLAALAAMRPALALAQGRLFAPPPALVPILARPDRMFRVSVCLRPFRVAGPRMELEEIGAKKVVHHYGHGGSGWSLSWGSAQEIMPLVLATGAKEVAVIGAGAIGMTTAITAQRMGLKATVYARERFPNVRSARATGTWSPASRVAMQGSTDAAFETKWERMTRATYAMHQSYMGLGGNPVEWLDRYALSDTAPSKQPHTPVPLPGGGTDYFVDYEEKTKDLQPQQELLAPGTHPFPAPFVRKTSSIMFNIADLMRHLEMEFQVAGGRFVPMELASAADFAKIREKTIINCTGYGARALMKDESVIPVRGQLAWLLPQEGVHYGVSYRKVSALARRDGIVIQHTGPDESQGFNSTDETPDYAVAQEAIGVIASCFVPAPVPAPAA